MGTGFFLAVIYKRFLFLESNFFLSTHSEGIHIVEIWCVFVSLLKDLGSKNVRFAPCILLGSCYSAAWHHLRWTQVGNEFRLRVQFSLEVNSVNVPFWPFQNL